METGRVLCLVGTEVLYGDGTCPVFGRNRGFVSNSDERRLRSLRIVKTTTAQINGSFDVRIIDTE